MCTAQPNSPTAMSNDELRALCAPHAWERQLERRGCLLPLIASVAGTTAFVWLGAHPLKLSAVQIVIAGLVLFGVLGLGSVLFQSHVAGLRRAPFRAELRRRYGMSSPTSYADEERVAIARTDGPAWSVLLSAAALPNGGHRWIRVRIWNAPTPTARLEVRSVQWPQGSCEIEHAGLYRAEGELAEPSRVAILAFIEDHLSSLATVESLVRDGLPCTLTIVGRDGSRVVSCNLAGVTSAQASHPTIRFADMMLAAGKQVASPELLTGWCDATGSIGIGPI